jgi:hypothetical protein
VKGFILIAATAAVSSTSVPPAHVDRIAWLQGCWEQAASGRTIEEHWMAPRGGTMLGLGRTVKDGVLVEYEMVIIKEQDGRLAYEAHPSGQASAVFLSRSITADQVVFENPAHDFPTEIGYERKDDGLTAWIQGIRRGAVKRVEFQYRRVECVSSPPAASSLP